MWSALLLSQLSPSNELGHYPSAELKSEGELGA